jgi:hypothetical protein
VASTEPFRVSALVIAEAGYLIGSSLGAAAEAVFIRSMATDRFDVEGPTQADLLRAAELMATDESLLLGATDACVVALGNGFKIR